MISCCKCFSTSSNGDTKVAPENIGISVTDQSNYTNTSISPRIENKDGIERQRNCTDIFFLILTIFYICTLIILVIHCMQHADVDRIIFGYDDCGNICGRTNEPDESIGCKGSDFTNQKFLMIEYNGDYRSDTSNFHRTCVATCSEPQFSSIFNRCVNTKSQEYLNKFFSKTGGNSWFQQFAEDLETCWREILYSSIISLVLAMLLVFLLRFVVDVIIWIVLIGIVIACIAGTIFLWIKWSYEKNLDKEKGMTSKPTTYYLIGAICLTIATTFICLTIFVLRKRIKLVGQLFKEAGKAVSSMPILLFQPIVTVIALLILLSLWIYFAVSIESAGILTIKQNQSAKYVKTTTMEFARWYNLFALIWISQFFIGCQHMIVATSVAQWFFIRNKSKLGTPIFTSYYILARYHLGTVALGALVIAIIKFIRILFKIAENAIKRVTNDNGCVRAVLCCVRCCLSCFENIIQIVTRNAYIITAIYGYSFCKAGSRAWDVLKNNALRVMAINSVGDFVLFFSKILVVVVTLVIGNEILQNKEGVTNVYVPLVVLGIFSYFIASCFISVYEMVIDTIFICFCEDCDMNDGMLRPYFMSKGLMEYVQNSKKVLNVNDGRKSKAWPDRRTSNSK